MSKVLNDVSRVVWNKLNLHDFRNNSFVNSLDFNFLGTKNNVFYCWQIVSRMDNQMFVIRVPYYVLIEQHKKKKLHTFLAKQFINGIEKLLLGIKIGRLIANSNYKLYKDYAKMKITNSFMSLNKKINGKCEPLTYKKDLIYIDNFIN